MFQRKQEFREKTDCFTAVLKSRTIANTRTQEHMSTKLYPNTRAQNYIQIQDHKITTEPKSPKLHPITRAQNFIQTKAPKTHPNTRAQNYITKGAQNYNQTKENNITSDNKSTKECWAHFASAFFLVDSPHPVA